MVRMEAKTCYHNLLGHHFLFQEGFQMVDFSDPTRLKVWWIDQVNRVNWLENACRQKRLKKCPIGLTI